VPTIISAWAPVSILGELRAAGGDVIGADWRTPPPLDEAWERHRRDRAIQGNLDPTLLLGPARPRVRATDEILAAPATVLATSSTSATYPSHDTVEHVPSARPLRSPENPCLKLAYC